MPEGIEHTPPEASKANLDGQYQETHEGIDDEADEDKEIDNKSFFDIEIDGQVYKLESTKKSVDYPEYLQKETGGVLGHERVSISWEEITHLMLKLNGMEDFQVDNLQQFRELFAVSGLVKRSDANEPLKIKIPDEIRENGTISDLHSFFSKESVYLRYCKQKDFDPHNPGISNKDYISEEDFYIKLEQDSRFSNKIDFEKMQELRKIFEDNPGIDFNDKIEKFAHIPDSEIANKILTEVLEQVISRFSGGRFIKDTYNHYSRGIKPEVFKRQKLYLQKVTSPEFYSELIQESENKYIRMSGRSFEYLDIDTNEINKGIDDSRYFHGFRMRMNYEDARRQGGDQFVGKAKEDELEKLRDLRQNLSKNHQFLLTIGHNGLDVQGGELWSDAGLRKILDSNVYGFSTSNKAFAHYVESVDGIFESVYTQKVNQGKINQYGNLSDSDDGNTKRFLSSYLREKAVAISPSPNSDEGKKYASKIWGRFASQDDLYAHPSIPICIGHPNIPELKWCHAQYASIPSKKGLNLLTFKS